MNRSRLGAVLLAISLVGAYTPWPSVADSSLPRGHPWAPVHVDLPISETPFPPGTGSEIATSQCLICHSAGMILRQPPLTQEQWLAEINKMRSAFGAPIPANQVDALATYLSRIGIVDSNGT
jgi:mono/diheme cytochrome c family protein